jgi:hypothetical protein
MSAEHPAHAGLRLARKASGTTSRGLYGMPEQTSGLQIWSSSPAIAFAQSTPEVEMLKGIDVAIMSVTLNDAVAVTMLEVASHGS